MAIIINWLLAALAIMATAYLLPGVSLAGFVPALVTALLLGLLNAFIKPVLLFLTLPINIMTLGLFTLVINAALIMLVSKLVSGFHVQSFWWALGFSVVLTMINWGLSIFKQ